MHLVGVAGFALVGVGVQWREWHLAAAIGGRVERPVCLPTLALPSPTCTYHTPGFGTALLGKQAAMACTVAVEEVISEHYNDQIRMLLENGYTDEELKEVRACVADVGAYRCRCCRCVCR